MRELPLSKVYQLIEPGPVVMLTTAQNGKSNVMTMSWHMMVEFVPPLIACVVSSAGCSFATLMAERECVIAIPKAELAPVVVKAGNSSGRTIDKFKELGLTPLPAQLVSAPLIAECFANLECRVVDTSLVDKYDIFVLEVVKAWIDPRQREPRTIHHHGYGNFVVDGETLTLKSKMP
jgi:flavin reductase (DIM6/NTAB) family NADH-FMN oxidoreductase RutF